MTDFCFSHQAFSALQLPLLSGPDKHTAATLSQFLWSFPLFFLNYAIMLFFSLFSNTPLIGFIAFVETVGEFCTVVSISTDVLPILSH